MKCKHDSCQGSRLAVEAEPKRICAQGYCHVHHGAYCTCLTDLALLSDAGAEASA